jgi:hypothetical protein
VRSLLAAALLAAFVAAPRPAGAAPDKTQAIKVMPGDTLWSLSQKYLKDPKRWNVILKHNSLPTSDPTVALPGMTLKVPTEELKEKYQAATLLDMERSVSFREVESPSWNPAAKKMELFEDWGLRTQESSWARVTFANGGLLKLDANSMAILKSPKKADYELELKRGVIHTTVARVVTPSARIVPKGGDTKYSARILDDLSTRVQVYKGAADVQDLKGKKNVEVKAGFYTDVALDRAPATPTKMPNVDLAMAPEIRGLDGRSDAVVKLRTGAPNAPGAGSLGADLAALSVGVPVAAYRVQISRTLDFAKPVFSKNFDSGEAIDLAQAGLKDGSYFVRARIIDLLGEEGRWSAPKPYRPGGDDDIQSLAFSGSLEVTRPEEEEVRVKASRYRIMGRASRDLTVLINGERVIKDSDGAFSTEVLLKTGPNNFRIEGSDVGGNDKVLIRKIIYEP